MATHEASTCVVVCVALLVTIGFTSCPVFWGGRVADGVIRATLYLPGRQCVDPSMHRHTIAPLQ